MGQWILNLNFEGPTDQGETQIFLINCDRGGSLQNRVVNVLWRFFNSVKFVGRLMLFNSVQFVGHTLTLFNSVKFPGHLWRFSILYGS